LSALALTALIAACATDVEPQEETIQPSSGKLGQYQNVAIRPLVFDEDVGHAGQYIRKVLDDCMQKVSQPFDADALDGKSSVLIIEPSIVDLKSIAIGWAFS
jgi:hypothetical protein